MFFDSISASAQLSQAYEPTARKARSEDAQAQPLSPSSWGNDTISFSPEALAAQSNAAKQAEKNEEREENDAAAEFSKYLRQARGEESSRSSSLEEELENLKERLRKLEEKKQKEAEKAAEKGTTDTLQAKFEALDEEIAQVSSQIAELESLLMKNNGKSGFKPG